MAKTKPTTVCCTPVSPEDYAAIKQLRKSSEPSLGLRLLQGPPSRKETLAVVKVKKCEKREPEH